MTNKLQSAGRYRHATGVWIAPVTYSWFTQTSSEIRKEVNIWKNRSGKNTGIRENAEGLDFHLGVKLIRALINISRYIFH